MIHSFAIECIKTGHFFGKISQHMKEKRKKNEKNSAKDKS